MNTQHDNRFRLPPQKPRSFLRTLGEMIMWLLLAVVVAIAGLFSAAMVAIWIVCGR
jgi:hypothetical protein